MVYATLHKHTQYYKIKQLTLFLLTIKTVYCTFLSADKWLVLALACFQTMAALHKNKRFIFTVSWAIFWNLIRLLKHFDFFQQFFFYFSDIKNQLTSCHSFDKKKSKILYLNKIWLYFFLYFREKSLKTTIICQKRKSRLTRLSFTYQ